MTIEDQDMYFKMYCSFEDNTVLGRNGTDSHRVTQPICVVEL